MRKISGIFITAELELKIKNQIDMNANCSDLNIKVQNSRFHTKLFDKQKNFDFNIISMSHKSSSTRHEMFYSAMSAEILPIRKRNKFAKTLIGRIIKQWGLKNHMKKTLLKLSEKLMIIFCKKNYY